MKNFTNNFKQFTSRLSARWLIMALMMLVGTSSAWAAAYLSGGFNSWGAQAFSNGTCSISLNANTTYEFKIRASNTNWDTSYGNNGTMTSTNCTDWLMSTSAGNCKITTTVAGTYVFKFNESTKKLSVTYPTATAYVLGGYINGADKNYSNGIKLTKQADGTYSVTKNDFETRSQYFQIFDDLNRTWGCTYAKKEVGESVTLETSKGDKVEYSLTKGTSYEIIFNPNNGSLLVKLACVTLTTPKLTATNVVKCGDNYTDGKITISGYDANTYTYELKNSSNQTVNKTYNNNNGYTFTKDEVGTYKVIMKRKDNTQCEPVTTSETTISITDNTPAIGDFKVEASSTTVCSGTQITLTATHINGASYEWFLNNSQTPISGATSYQYKPTITADATYKVVVTKTSNSCPASKNASVSVTKIPVPTQSDFDITLPNNPTYDGIAKNATVTPKNGITGMGDVTINYYKDGNKTTPTDAGTYTVKITVSAGTTYCAMSETQIGTFTIKKATQDELSITNEQVKYCGLPAEDIVLTTEGGTTAGNVTFTSDDESVATIVNNKLHVIKEGTVNITATMAENDNYEPITSKAKQFTFYKAPDKPIAQVVNIKLCKGEPTNGKIVISNVNPAYEYTINSAVTGNAKDGFVISNAGDYIVTVTRNVDGCSMSTNSDPITVGTDDNTPTITDVTISGDAEVCVNTGTTLTASATTDKGTLSYLWNTNATTASIETEKLTETTTYTVTITATNAGCAVSIPTVLSKTITVNPLSAPTISASANSGVNAIDLTINVQDAGCAPNYTLGYRIKQSDDLEYSENQVVKASTTETQASTTIEGLITGVEYVIQAYIINGYNNNEVFYTDPITCTVLASENCVVPSANYIEILANNDENLQLYAWVEGKGTTPLGGWPGKTRDTWYEVNSKGYSVWKIESSDPVYLIFNKGDNSKTADIKGTDNEGFKPGYRYIFNVKNDWNFEVQDPTIIADPEVQTISATPVRLPNGNSNVTIQGRVLKKGCADIQVYGFQYKLIDADNYETVNVATADIAVGEIFEKTIELPVGTYFIRARVVNANGSKAYGDEFRITIAERDLTIAAVHDDTSVDTETYYDFVGLYMSSITKPTNVEVTSYTWYKDGEVYNPTINESSEYGATYINSNGSNNIRPNQTGTYKLKVQLSNEDIFESNEIEVSKASKVNASSILNASNRTLPVISVRTNKDFPTCKSGSYPSAQADDLKKKRSVDVKIFDKDGKLYYDRKARMNYRGSSSLNFVKKSYAFCPGDEMCGDVEKGLDYVITKKVNMFNLGAEDKDWVLYAAAADPSLMRNRIVFDTYAAMTNKWGVKSMFVELVVDGNYKGVYVFMDKITKNKNRVNITAADGFIVKFDKTDIADRYVDGKQEDSDEKTFMTVETGKQGIDTYGTQVDQMFEIEYPEKDDNKGTWNNIVASIKDKFETFETALAEGNYSKVREIIDYDSWADWFIINEYIKNQDAYRASCIFVYNGEKIEARPLWDQELSMNNTSHTSHNCDDTNSLLITTASIYGDDFPAPFWFTGHDGASIEGGLLKDGCFISLVQKKLADYLKEGAALYAGEDAKDKRGPILKLAHDFNEELVSKTEGQTSAQEREDKFWEGKSRSSAECGGTHSYSQSSYSNEYGNVKNWILGDRDENLTSILDGMSGEMTSGISITTSPDNAIVTPWIPITVTVNVADDAEYIYDDSSITQGIELDVDKAITSKSGNKYTYTFPRPADWNVDNVETAIEQIVYPINAQLKVKDTTCPGVSNETQIRIRLRDEGNDICGELIEQ